ncbi:MAG: sulfotransferase domain-containing protein [Verrucomicrobiota bacterium]
MSGETVKHPIVWLASYPKSGNTWLRFSVTALIQGELPTSQIVKEQMPDIHEPGFKLYPLLEQGLCFVKTHHMYADTMQGAGQTAGFIYMIRNPIDVLASNYNYILRNAPQLARPIEEYVATYLEQYGDPRWIGLKMGSWIENVSTWVELSSKTPGLLLRYEDMIKDPVAVLKLIAQYLNLERSDEQVERAAELCSFSSMREMEEREIQNQIKGMFFDVRKSGILENNKRFVNQGGSKGAKMLLSDSLRDEIAERFRPIAEKLGYDL